MHYEPEENSEELSDGARDMQHEPLLQQPRSLTSPWSDFGDSDYDSHSTSSLSTDGESTNSPAANSMYAYASGIYCSSMHTRARTHVARGSEVPGNLLGICSGFRIFLNVVFFERIDGRQCLQKKMGLLCGLQQSASSGA